MRNVGELGENLFRAWCSQSGLSPTRPDVDKYGWDFIVEFPFLSPSFEIDESAPECRVQIKSTDSQKRSLPVKLSVLKRMATQLMPSFFVFIEFDKRNDAQRVFVVHLGKEQIYDTLKRIHLLQAEDPDVNLSKKTKVIHYDESHLLEYIDGQCLKDAFLREIGGDYGKYVSEKSAYLKEVGFEEGGEQFSFSLPAAQSYSLFEMSLGVTNKIEVKNVKHFKTRFGIKTAVPELCSDFAHIEILEVKPTGVGVVKFREKNSLTPLVFKAELYTSALIDTVSDDKKKARIVCALFELEIFIFTGSMQFHPKFHDSQRFPLVEFIKLFKLMKIFNGNQDFTTELSFKNVLDIKGESFLDKVFDERLDGLEASFYLKRIQDKVESADEVQISFAELIAIAGLIKQIHALVYKKGADLQVKFHIVGELDKDKKHVIFKLFKFSIGDCYYGMMLALFGEIKEISDENNVSKVGNKLLMDVSRYNVINQVFLRQDDFSNDEEWALILKKQVEHYDDKFNVIHPPYDDLWS
ncbi:hypothetical protein [Thiomicrorhabdus sediminis]|uniref:DUF4365 domain-containing protein n=1 Tax=Thiomicrorhabdus sediminis TaxID=2580412 RepID=A0A4P9K3W2_9GAMM|nr:hypothetical protein [Thiomicrorhabdus sediminis]QCU89592.1 hypothetical protein FE785_02540 [Thiomicrorhabdus sediminis]